MPKRTRPVPGDQNTFKPQRAVEAGRARVAYNPGSIERIRTSADGHAEAFRYLGEGLAAYQKIRLTEHTQGVDLQRRQKQFDDQQMREAKQFEASIASQHATRDKELRKKATRDAKSGTYQDQYDAVAAYREQFHEDLAVRHFRNSVPRFEEVYQRAVQQGWDEERLLIELKAVGNSFEKGSDGKPMDPNYVAHMVDQSESAIANYHTKFKAQKIEQLEAEATDVRVSRIQGDIDTLVDKPLINGKSLVQLSKTKAGHKQAARLLATNPALKKFVHNIMLDAQVRGEKYNLTKLQATREGVKQLIVTARDLGMPEILTGLELKDTDGVAITDTALYELVLSGEAQAFAARDRMLKNIKFASSEKTNSNIMGLMQKAFNHNVASTKHDADPVAINQKTQEIKEEIKDALASETDESKFSRYKMVLNMLDNTDGYAKMDKPQTVSNLKKALREQKLRYVDDNGDAVDLVYEALQNKEITVQRANNLYAEDIRMQTIYENDTNKQILDSYNVKVGQLTAVFMDSLGKGSPTAQNYVAFLFEEALEETIVEKRAVAEEAGKRFLPMLNREEINKAAQLMLVKAEADITSFGGIGKKLKESLGKGFMKGLRDVVGKATKDNGKENQQNNNRRDGNKQ